MQIGVDVICMYANFGGCCHSGFGDIATFKMLNFWTIIVHRGQKIELVQNIYASKGGCETHANQFWWAWHLQF